MTTSSITAEETARKNLTAGLKAVSNTGQKPIAEAIKVSEGTVSKHMDGHFERTVQILSHAGIKLVPVDRVCVRAEEYRMMTRIVSRALANEETADQLLFEDPE